MATMPNIDRFAELLAEGLEISQIRERMRLTKGQAAGLFRRIKEKLGEQAR